MTRTYSSIREAMQCGILDEAAGAAAPPQDAPPSSSDAAAGVPGARRPSRRSSSWTINSSFTSNSSSIASSFTAGTSRRTSYRPDTRRSSFQSSFGSIDEDAPGMIAIREIRLSNDSPEPEEMDLSEMGAEDLDRLKSEDPFAYFSIPEVRRRSYRMEGGAASDILREILQDDPMVDEPQEEDAADASHHQGPPPGEARRSRSRHQQSRLRASMPAGMLADADIARSHFDARSSRSVVSKRSRLSCEAHPTLVCEELLLGLANGDDDIPAVGGGDAGAGAGEEDEMMAEERLLQMMMANAAAEGGWGQDPAE